MDQDPLLLAILDSGLAHCRAVVVKDGNLLVALFMAGLTGGFLHCTGMCGPFVLSQVGARLESIPATRMREWHRVTGAALVPYHLGRATTYALLGAMAGVLAGTLGGFATLKTVSAGLLILAGLLFIAQALPRLGPLIARGLPLSLTRLTPPGLGALERAAERLWSASLGKAARGLFAAPVGWRGYILGLLLGFLPCGMLYGAVAAAAATGDPLGGAFGMLAFALGTVPALVGVGLAGHLAGLRWRTLITERVAPMLLALNGIVLSGIAVGMLM